MTKPDKVPKSAGKLTKSPNLTGGSRKGKPNLITKQLKEMILGALDDVGGQVYLARQAEENPTAFLALIGKVLPSTLNIDADNTSPIPVSIYFNVVDASENADAE